MQSSHSLRTPRPLPKPPIRAAPQPSAREELGSSGSQPRRPAEKLDQVVSGDDTIHPDASILLHIIHFNGFDLTFDLSCFEGLDSQLLYHPLDAYSDLCWAEATRTEHTRTVNAEDNNTIVYTDTSNSLTPTQSVFWADEEDNGDGQTSRAASPATPLSPDSESPCPPYSPPHPALSYRLSVNIGELQRPLMSDGMVESLFVKMHVCDPSDAIQLFPTGSRHPKSINRGQRFATFCGRLARSGSDDVST